MSLVRSNRPKTEYCVMVETKQGRVLTLARGFASREAAEEYPVKSSLWVNMWVEAIQAAPTEQKVRRVTREERLTQCFESILQAALRGDRCPENDTYNVASTYCRLLAERGDIKIEVYARNYRVVTILKGPHAGVKTAPPPYSVKSPKIIISTEGKKVYRMFSRLDRKAKNRLK